jgi:hypothetical protein
MIRPKKRQRPTAKGGMSVQSHWSRLELAAVAALSTAMLVTLPCVAADWQKEWSSVKGNSAKRCAELFDNFQLQAVCMENEKNGYDKMQGNVGMPADVANKAKDRCEKLFDTFQLQAVCMENEHAGYEKMKQY